MNMAGFQRSLFNSNYILRAILLYQSKEMAVFLFFFNQAGIPGYTDLYYKHLGMGTVYKLFFLEMGKDSLMQRYKTQKMRYLRK